MSLSAQPSLTVIIPTRNRLRVLKECLWHLSEEVQRSSQVVEVVIIDTSNEPVVLDVGGAIPHLRVVYVYDGDSPFSMVRSRNRGLSMASSDIVACIDDDCFVRPNWVMEILRPYDRSEIAAVGGRIIYHPWHEPRLGGPVAGMDLSRDSIWGEWDRVVHAPVPVPHLPGGNFSVRREVALSLAGFDPAYTGSANLEESDFFCRLGRLGGVILYNSAAVVEHRAASRADGIVRSHTNFIYRYSAVRNRLYFLRKHRAGRGLRVSVARQLVDSGSGTLRLFAEAGVFVAALVAGLISGLCTPLPTGKHHGLARLVPTQALLPDSQVKNEPQEPKYKMGRTS